MQNAPVITVPGTAVVSGTAVPGATYSTVVSPPGPGRNIVPGPPRIGFYYTLIPGYGYRIVSVDPWSPAAQLGLLRGDIVLSLNGVPLTHYGADLPARDMAAAAGGWITAYVRDIRTGLMTTRSVNLFNPQATAPTSTTTWGSSPAINGSVPGVASRPAAGDAKAAPPPSSGVETPALPVPEVPRE
jgi:hypothetical protein